MSTLSRSDLLAAVLHRWVDAGEIVGGVILLAEGGEVTGQAVAGLADREARQPMQRNTILRYASMTKLLVSALALKLCEEDVLSLDAPVTNWLPAFCPKLENGRTPKITVHHLLTHTAGLSYGFEQPPGNKYEKAGISDGLDSSGITLEENLCRLASVPLFFPPGSAWQYSIATDVLGAVMQAATGTDLAGLLDEKILSPLHMPDTGFGSSLHRNVAPAYWNLGHSAVRVTGTKWYPVDGGRCLISEDRGLRPNEYASAGAGLAGSADDYMHFLLCLRGKCKGLLSEQSIDQMLSNAIGSVRIPSRGSGWSFGLGPMILAEPVRTGSKQGRGTWTWCGVHGCHYWVDPENDIVLVALTNTGVTGAWGGFAEELITAIYKTF